MRWRHVEGGQVQYKRKRTCSQFDIVASFILILWNLKKKKKKIFTPWFHKRLQATIDSQNIAIAQI